MDNLAYLHGKPLSTGDLRTRPEDFCVSELLPFQPTGEGEHLLIHLEKKGVNTVFVARQLATYFKVRDNNVSYAGLKDKHAVCQQYFSVHLPGKSSDDVSQFKIAGVKVLSIVRHNKKLRIGALVGNKFDICLRNVTHSDMFNERWEKITKTGVPNYYGEQRFGRGGNNLLKAQEMFAGKKIKDKKKRGFYLSAARSNLFNQCVSQRISDNIFSDILVGDVCMLSGSQSVFLVDTLGQDLTERLNRADIHLTAPLWGQGMLMTQGNIKDFEQEIADKNLETANGLIKFGLKQERRAIRLTMASGHMTIEPNIKENESEMSTVKLSFFLPAGSFATTILRELLCYTDCSLALSEHE